MEKILYLDCFSGISGDMTLAALIDAGANLKYINQELRRFLDDSVELKVKPVNKMGISAKQLEILLEPKMAPVNRNYSAIRAMISESPLVPDVKKNAVAIFQVIATAEAKIHGVPIEQVHFHEIGAIDSIVDIVGVALALESLQVKQVFASPVPLGSGRISVEHGIYPNPAPATIEILKGMSINLLGLQYEITTPTGAAIVAALASQAITLAPINVERIGYGAGTLDLPDRPNVLRAYVGKVEQMLHQRPNFNFEQYGESLSDMQMKEKE
jgi:uncharacterized protein (TIGR00299 family) protein